MRIVVTSERLLLRELTPGDAPLMYALNADPEVIRYTGDPPFASVEAARAFLAAYPAYRADGFGRWAVVRRADGECLGWCGLRRQESGEVDLGYRFFRRYWGQGYATEASRAALSWGFAARGLPSILARAMRQNTASIRVMERLGMRYEGESALDDDPGVLYRAFPGDTGGSRP